MAYEVVQIEGLRPSKRRAIVFLRSGEGDALNAAAVFQGLPAKREMELRSHFDYWIDDGICNRYFHGWPGHPQYKQCFTFKWKDRRKDNRFYGFLWHPTPIKNKRFLLCVLCSHAMKTRWRTNPSELATVERLRLDSAVQRAIAAVFPDTEGVSWVH